MKREIITTADGSKTIQIVDWNEQYHSKHGAIQEARHVFIATGLAHYVNKFPELKKISILEMGFGTGLNALLTYFERTTHKVMIDYVGVEAFPISQAEIEAMDYAKQLETPESEKIYKDLHASVWNKKVAITGDFSLTKRMQTFENSLEMEGFDIIYFDAFGPRVQPDLWTERIFSKMFTALKTNGVLTTYCAQGAARRAMQAVGFSVERLPGPPGKREMLRATKLS